MLNQDTLRQLKTLKTEIRDSKNTERGIVHGTRWTYGFVSLSDGRDILLPKEQMLKVFPNDDVMINIVNTSKKPTAIIEKVMNSPLKTIVGQVSQRGAHYFLLVDYHGFQTNLFIPPHLRLDAKNGDYVAAKIHKHPFKTGKAQAKITKVYEQNTAQFKIDYILDKFDLKQHDEFTSNLKEDLNHKYDTALQSSSRVDLSSLHFITVDHKTTQDIDDAIYAEEIEQGWKIIVAIADPTELFEKNDSIDINAKNLSGSVYLPRFYIPLLPKDIAHDYASLVPGKKRLTMICEMIFDTHQNDFTSCSVYEGIIESKEKTTYEQIDTLLKEPDTVNNTYKSIFEAGKCLTEYLDRKSCSLFDNSTSTSLQLDCDYNIKEILQHKTSDAQKLIESFMVSTNMQVALWMKNNKITAPFLHHPGIKKSQKLLASQLLKHYDESLHHLNLSSLNDFHTLIHYTKQLDDTNDSSSQLCEIIKTYLDKSAFNLINTEHFYLGLEHYTHFTSPIRRYQDILVHRQIKHYLHTQKTTLIEPADIEHLNKSITRNRLAKNQLTDWLLAEWIKKQAIETHYQGVISSLQGNQIGVSLNQLGINGNIDIADLKPFSFNGSNKTLKTDSGHILTLGKTITLQLKRINKKNNQLVFKWVTDQ
jgi:VacB/RNase II family 3'-5' exoribonuclease